MGDLKITGPWSMPDIETFFAQAAIPMRLSVISKAGWPVVLCTSRGHSKVILFLRSNPRCGLEIAGESPPYHGVRGQGAATISKEGGAALLERLADRYIGQVETPFRKWLLAGAEEEVAITITPIRLMSWDYRNRMTVK